MPLPLVSPPFRKSGWKSAIYYFPVDDSGHGCPINAGGPEYIYFHYSPHKMRLFLLEPGFYAGGIILLNRSINFHKLSIVDGAKDWDKYHINSAELHLLSVYFVHF